MERRFIESPKFPIWEVNMKSTKEKGPARPPYWEMVFYWTRKPLIGARAVIAGALLPENIDSERFKTLICLNESTPHRSNPRIPPEWECYFKGKKLLDPFAGFGSIPLEGLRLGLDVTAVELLPTTYVFLKAVLDYPKKFGKSLVKDVERWGNWIVERLKSDPEIRELYDDDVAVYIGTWEVKCPHCGRWTPAIGNFWLARVKDNRGYKRLAYMVPEQGSIRVIDLNEVFGDVSKASVDTKGGEIVFEGERYVRKAREAVEKGKLRENDFRVEGDKVVFRVPSPNIEARKSQLTCLACGNVIKYVDEGGRHYTERRKGSNEFYVKFALRKYHEGDERFARQRLLVKVKVKDKDLVFEPATTEDSEKLLKAKERVRELIEKKDPDVPTEKMQPYGGATLGDIYKVFIEWKNLFNPRQLLTLIKIVRLIREVGKRVEEEKLGEGWEKEKAFEYAEAVATYLSMALVKFADYNSITTSTHVSNPRGMDIGSTLSTRGVAMKWNFVEENPLQPNATISGIFVNSGAFSKMFRGILRGLTYLTSALAPSNQKTLTKERSNTVKVLQADATSLNLGEKFDVIVTDPPYADDVAYTELSDFYYVWLKRALSDSDGKRLIPRFHRTAFFRKIGPKWVGIKTQWQEFAKKEVSMYPARFGGTSGKEAKTIAQQHFENLFAQAFVAMREHLRDDGILVTYYAHTDPESWANLIEAGWKRAKLQITRAIPLNTESSQSIVSRGKLSLDTSIVAVWRKPAGERRPIQISALREKLEEKARKSAKEFIRHGYRSLDLLYAVMASVLEEVTGYGEVLSPKGSLSTKEVLEEVYRATIRGIIEAIAEVEEGKAVTSREAIFYTAYKVLFGNGTLKPNDIILLNLATLTEPNGLVKAGVLKATDSSSKKEFTLYTPDLLGKKALDARELQKFLYGKGLNPLDPKPRNSVDVLQLLEYYTLLGKSRLEEAIERLRRKWSAEVEEALTIAGLITDYYTAVYGQLLAPLGGRIKADEREIEKELEKDGHFEVLLMRRLLRSVRGGVL